MAKKKQKLDTRLFIIRNTRKTLKYYFKNIFYILFMNFAVFYAFNVFFKDKYATMISSLTNSDTSLLYKILYYGIFLLIFYTMKIILYGNTIYIMRKDGKNDIKDLFSIVSRRFLSTLGTFIFYIFTVIFFTCLLVLPGIMFAFYFFFAMYLSSLGDLNEDNKMLNGAKALGRSYRLVKGNLFRFMFMTFVIVFLALFVEKTIIAIVVDILEIELSSFTLNAIRLTAFDMLIIYTSLLFNKLEGIENDVLEEKAFKKDQQEELMMREAAVNQFKNR